VWICRCAVLTPSMAPSLSPSVSPSMASSASPNVSPSQTPSQSPFAGAQQHPLATDGESSHLTTSPQVEEGPDYCVITPPKDGLLKAGVAIDTYDDHRMAMAFSLAACGNTSVVINDPGCTRKTFPTYFDVLSTLVK